MYISTNPQLLFSLDNAQSSTRSIDELPIWCVAMCVKHIHAKETNVLSERCFDLDRGGIIVGDYLARFF
jgi:hypothetical protein